MNAPLPLKVTRTLPGPGIYEAVAGRRQRGGGPAGQAPGRRDPGRRAVLRGRPRPLRHRRFDLPGHAGRRVRAAQQRRRCAGPGHLPRPESAHRAARRRHQPVRPDGGRRAGHRPLAPRAQHPARRRRAAHRRGRARHGAGPPERGAEEARPVVSGRRLHQRAGHAGRHGGQQFLRQPQHRLRQHGAQRAGRAGLDGRRPPASLRPLRRGRRRSARAGDCRCRRWPPRSRPRSSSAGPRCCAASAATTWTSSTTRTSGPTPTTARSTSRTCWSAAKARWR